MALDRQPAAGVFCVWSVRPLVGFVWVFVLARGMLPAVPSAGARVRARPAAAAEDLVCLGSNKFVQWCKSQ